MDGKVSAVKEELENRLSEVDKKQTEMCDIQSTLDCKVDKLEEEIRLLKEMSKHRHSENQCDFSDTSDSS